MKLLFKQRAFSWFDSYDVYDEAGNTVVSRAASVYQIPGPLRIYREPADYILEQAPATAWFDVSFTGGNAPYTVLWEYKMNGTWYPATAYGMEYNPNPTGEHSRLRVKYNAHSDWVVGLTYLCTVTDTAGDTVVSVTAKMVQE